MTARILHFEKFADNQSDLCSQELGLRSVHRVVPNVSLKEVGLVSLLVLCGSGFALKVCKITNLTRLNDGLADAYSARINA